MTLGRGWFLSLVALTALWAPCAAADVAGAISGVVRNAAGKPVEGAKVSLASNSLSAKVAEAITDRDGKYQFVNLPAGNYSLRAEAAELAAGPQIAKVSGSSSSAIVDLILSRKPAETHAAQDSAAAPPKFEAAGVRGLIDPGGYSAPANAAAASGMIKGMADIKRRSNRLGMLPAKDWPCDLETGLKKSVDASPKDSTANRTLGEFYLAHDQVTDALPLLEAAHDIDASDVSTSKDLAAAWAKSGRFDAAKTLLTSLNAKPDDPQIHSLLAGANEGLGLFPQASQDYAAAAANDPSEENLFGVGYELILSGLPADAGRAFLAGVSRYPRSIFLLLGLGAAQFLQSQTSGAVETFLKVADLAPANPGPYAFLSSASVTSDAQSARVRASLRHFLAVAPANAQAPYFYALNLSKSPDNGASEANEIEGLLKRSISLDPNFAKAHFQLASIYAQHGNYEGARQEYETTVKLAPDLAEAHYRLAGVYRHTGRNDLASRETEIFRQAHAKESAADDHGISIEEFVSVLGGTGDQSAANLRCEGVTH